MPSMSCSRTRSTSFLRSDDDRTRFGEEPEEQDEGRVGDGVRITGATPAGEDPLADWSFPAPS
jgi:hypothetical protein